MSSEFLSRLPQGLRRWFAGQPQTSTREINRANDVFVASYPRSGNNWLRLMLCDAFQQLAGITTATRLPIHQDEIIPDINSSRRPGWDLNLKLPARMFKTHGEYDRQMNRVILIIRRPADCFCSYYHYLLRYEFLHEFAARGVDQFCCQQIPAWKRHLTSYLKAIRRDPGNVFVTSYEQLYFDPVRILQAVGEFLDVPLTASVCRTAVDNHQFAKHRKLARARGKFYEFFYRRGEIDSARSELSAEAYRTIQAAALPLYVQASKHFSVKVENELPPQANAA